MSHFLPAGCYVQPTDFSLPVHCLLQTLDCSACDNMASLMEYLGQALQFPDWYGGNQDAFIDCFADAEWSPPQPQESDQSKDTQDNASSFSSFCLQLNHVKSSLYEELTETLQYAAEERSAETELPVWIVLR